MAHHWSGRSTTGACGPSWMTRARRRRKAAMPAAPCIHEVPGGSRGGSWRCSANRHRAPAWSRMARWSRASAMVRAPCSSGPAATWPVLSCAASSRTSPTPAVPQQRRRCPKTPGGAAVGCRKSRSSAAPVPQPCYRQPGHGVHAGVSQRREQVGGPCRSVAPGVGHRIYVPAGAGQGMRHDEPAAIQRAHGQHVLRAVPRRGDEVIPAQGRPGNRQRRGYPSGAVRVIRHPGRPARQHGPVQAVASTVGRFQQALATGRRDRPGGLTTGPHRGQHHPRRAPDQISHRCDRPSLELQGGVPPRRGHQLGEPR
jgi:hypothetical protein